jgi:hypothetical protein
MGNIVVHEFTTLDSVIDAPTWTFDFGFDPRMGTAIAEIMGSCNGLLLGHRTLTCSHRHGQPGRRRRIPVRHL